MRREQTEWPVDRSHPPVAPNSIRIGAGGESLTDVIDRRCRRLAFSGAAGVVNRLDFGGRKSAAINCKFIKDPRKAVGAGGALWPLPQVKIESGLRCESSQGLLGNIYTVDIKH